MTMRLRFWGTRGSVPTPGPRTIRYGGNTPCVEVRTATGGLIILDAGTGMRELGRSLVGVADDADGEDRIPGRGAIDADVFLTHAHWDHVQGIPFFAPIYQAGNRFTIWGSGTLPAGLDQVVRDLMTPAVFPVAFDELKATLEFCTIDAGARHVGDGYEVSAIDVQHPGGALGYRFSDGTEIGGSFVYISDNELGSSESYSSAPDWKARLVEFTRGATLLVHDATYTAFEYERHRGWGHSTYDDAVELALSAGVQQLVLFHHKPERSDDEVDACLANCRALVAARGSRLEVVAAHEGMQLTV
jgi:phosphoribosyl 1,2-cyclic phosphodiesterase